MLAAGGELFGNGGGEFSRKALNYFCVVFTQALDHQIDASFGSEFALTDIGAGQSGVSGREHIWSVGHSLRSGADAAEDFFTRFGWGSHFASLCRAAHQPWKVWSGRPRRSRVWVHLAPMPGSE